MYEHATPQVDTGPPAADIDQLSTLLKACGEPLRLEILRVLDQRSFGVQELCRIFDLRQPTMSHHLKVLALAGLVAPRREGNYIFYFRLNQSTSGLSQSLWHSLLASIDELPLRPMLGDGIRAVHADRTEASRLFFEQNAGRFSAQQELISDFREYARPVCELMDAAPLPGYELALEIGPGRGDFLIELSTRFEQVLALDISENMLALATQHCRRQSLDNIEFVHGDSRSLSGRNIRPGCIVANMLLHHAPSPRDIFQDISQLLAAGGSVFLADLCRHDQDWVREACGDLWLGFEPDELSRWAASVGLREGQHRYFSQRNGFSVQIRQFIKPPGAGAISPSNQESSDV